MENIWDILDEKVNALHKEQFEKAKSDPHLASQLHVTGLFPEVEQLQYTYKPSLKQNNQN